MNLASELAKSGEAVKAGPIGLAVILILCIACYFLFKSMSKHMKRVREDFPSDEPTAAEAETEAGAGAEQVTPPPTDAPPTAAPPTDVTPTR